MEGKTGSSCLTLAEEVGKSQDLVTRYEQHAAKMIQVAARFFCTIRRVDVLGRRAPPEKVWSMKVEHGGEPVLQDYPPKDQPRCGTCTLPKGVDLADAKNQWCNCNRDDEENEAQAKMKKAELKAMTTAERQKDLLESRAKEKEVAEEKQRVEDEKEAHKKKFGLAHEHAKALEDGHTSGDEGSEHEIFGLDLAPEKKRWNAAVGAAQLMCLNALIRTDRLIPEHMVSESFKQLQDVVDKRKTTNCLGMIVAFGGEALSDDEDFLDDMQRLGDTIGDIMDSGSDHSDEAEDPTANLPEGSDVPVQLHKLRLKTAEVESILRGIFELPDSIIMEHFGMFDKNKNDIIAESEFKNGLRHVHKSLITIAPKEKGDHVDDSLATARAGDSLDDDDTQGLRKQDEQLQEDSDTVVKARSHVNRLSPLMVDAITQLVSLDQDRIGGVINYVDFVTYFKDGGRENKIEEFSQRVVEHGRDSRDHGYGVQGKSIDTIATADAQALYVTVKPEVEAESKDNTGKQKKAKKAKKSKKTKKERKGKDKKTREQEFGAVAILNPLADEEEESSPSTSPSAEMFESDSPDSTRPSSVLILSSFEAESAESSPPPLVLSGSATYDNPLSDMFEAEQGVTNPLSDMFEAEEDDIAGLRDKSPTKRKGRFGSGLSALKSVGGAPLSSVSKLANASKAFATKAARFHYRVIVDAAEVSTSEVTSSVAVGSLAMHAEFSTTARVVIDGVVRAKCDTGWVTAMTSERVLQLQEYFPDATYVYRAAYNGNMQTEVDEDSPRTGFFVKGSVITGLEQDWSPAARSTMRVRCDKGWLSVTVKNDKNLLIHQLVPEDQRDNLRWFLRRLAVPALLKQATEMGCDATAVAECDPLTCVNASEQLIEKIAEYYYTATQTMELQELPDGWAGAEGGVLKIGCRIEVQGECEGQPDPAMSKDEVEERRALNGRKGYAIREVGVGSYEIQLDGLRVTYTVERQNIRYLKFDETKPRRLFDCIDGVVNDVHHHDDIKQFRHLLRLPIDDEHAPVEATKPPGRLPLASVAERMELCLSDDGKTLYEFAQRKKAWHCASFLRHYLMFKAVEVDNLEDLVGLLDDGAASPQLDDDLDGDNHGLDAIIYADEDGLIEPGRKFGRKNPLPLIKIAHDKWEAGGSARTHYSAGKLGGKCWLELSERWYDMYGFHYDPERHTADTFDDLHEDVDISTIGRKLAVQDVSQAGKEELMETLDWRSRNAFMSRKTKF